MVFFGKTCRISLRTIWCSERTENLANVMSVRQFLHWHWRDWRPEDIPFLRYFLIENMMSARWHRRRQDRHTLHASGDMIICYLRRLMMIMMKMRRNNDGRCRCHTSWVKVKGDLIPSTIPCNLFKLHITHSPTNVITHLRRLMIEVCGRGRRRWWRGHKWRCEGGDCCPRGRPISRVTGAVRTLRWWKMWRRQGTGGGGRRHLSALLLLTFLGPAQLRLHPWLEPRPQHAAGGTCMTIIIS